MKKIFSLCIPVLFCLSAISQTDSVRQAPYLRFPTVPPFKLLKLDSSSYYTKIDLKKNKSVLIMLFNPDCDHCKHETEEIINHIDQLKNVQIVMATTTSFDLIKSFYEKYDLKRFGNITVGQDFQYVLPVFYRIGFMPYLAMYDKKGNLLSTFEGSMNIEDLIKVFE